MSDNFELRIEATDARYSAPQIQLAASFDHRDNLHAINQNGVGTEGSNRKYSPDALGALTRLDAFDIALHDMVKLSPDKIGGPHDETFISLLLRGKETPKKTSFAEYINWLVAVQKNENTRLLGENAQLIGKLDERMQHDEIAKKVTFEAVRQLREAKAEIAAFEKTIFGRVYTWLKNRKNK